MSKFFIVVCGILFCFLVNFSAESTFDAVIDPDHLLPDGHWFIDKIFFQFSNETTNYTMITKDALEEIMELLHLEIDHDHDHDHDHKKSLVKQGPKLDSLNYSTCYSSDELLEIFGIENLETYISKQDFEEMGSALIWMAINEECLHDHGGGSGSKTETELTERYVFGSITIVVTWFCSFIAVLIIGKIKKGREYLVATLRALAVGTLLSDSLLHLIPSALGLHSHENGHDEADHGHDDHSRADELDPIWKMSAVMGTIFAIWMFETFLHHGHTHPHNHECAQDVDHHKSCVDERKRSNETIEANMGVGADDVENYGTMKEKPIAMIEVKTNTSKAAEIKKSFRTVHPGGWVAFFGNCLHKLADGCAIGAAFSDSLSLGLSTALAIFFHEIPHELGDFAVLHSAGFKHYTILLLNTIASLFSLVGFFIIASVSSNVKFREWIFTVVIGVFLYIALVNMVPKLKTFLESKEKKLKMTMFIVGAFLLGWTIMLLLAIFEEDIRIEI